ncbi:hypothetical protein VNO78_18881 [Psophocarpus tetragonolobus]|uniref:Smr domain-containing protein n=1 Tax=Psophocarpus tetragonolobus TaxID=3891 RepID=A0AAN9SAX3_PSOTE
MMRVGLGNGQACPQAQEVVSWKLKDELVRIRMESRALTKQGERFLTKISISSSSSSHNLIRRFVQGSPKSVVLTTLSHLLSPSTNPHLSPLALPLYTRITLAPWFCWNPTTAAHLAALLHQLGHHAQSQTLVSDATSRLQSSTRQLVLFYGKLMESHSKRGSLSGFQLAYAYLHKLLCTCSSVYVKRRAYEYMVSGLCAMDRPGEAEDLALGLGLGLEPSGFELKFIVYGYGRLGLFEDMRRVVDEMEKGGFVVDTVCYNMVLSSYGIHGEHEDMVGWLRRMRNSGVPFSVRTYNCVTNCCPSVMRMGELHELEGGERMLVRELLGCRRILEEVMLWDSLEVKLDLHGFHLPAAYLIVLLWLDEMRTRFQHQVPRQVTLVSGSGNHSTVRGESPVRLLVQKMMLKMDSPLKLDRNNNGCFVAKGKPFKNWLCQLRNIPIQSILI